MNDASITDPSVNNLGVSDWSVDPIGGLWFVAVFGLLLFGLLFLTPRGKNLTTTQRRTLLILRTATAAILFFAMWRPMLVATDTKKLPGSLIVATDVSRSMQVADSLGNKSRLDAVKSVLKAAEPQLRELDEAWDLKFYQFGETAQPVEVVDGSPRLPESPDGPQTAIGSVIEDILDREAQQRVVAMLLLSDGAQRAFAPRDTPPQTAVQRLAIDEIPLFTFTFGKPALGLQSDLRVDDLLVSDSVFAETPVTVQAVLGVDGFANQKFKAQLLWEDDEGEMAVVDTREVEIKGDRRKLPLTLSHTPKKPGEYRVSVRVVDEAGEWPAGELVTTNNSQSTFVSVLKGGVNVLYLAGATRIGGGPSIEPRFVRSALAAHADISVKYVLLNYRKLRLDIRSLLEEEKFDVFMLGDVDVTALNNKSWEAIADAVETGAGLAMLGGFHSFGPGGFRGSAIEDLLPIRMGRAERQNFREPPRQDMHHAGPLRIAPREVGGKVHPILRLSGDDGSENSWPEIPPLDGANRFDRTKIKPTAQTIAESADANRHPLLVLGAWANGRTLAFAGDTTWHWPMEGFADAHRRFWRQLVVWLAKKDDTAGQSVFVQLDGRRYQRGSRVQFSIGALDEERNPLTSASFDVQVKKPDGTIVPVRSMQRGEQRIATFSETADPGDYEIIVSATSSGQVLGTTQARFTVPDRDMELDQPAAEPTLMASLANLTADAGGMGFAPEELPDLLEQLKLRTSEFEEEIREQKTLWDTWPVLLSLIGLLGSEWYLRKKWGLV